MNKIIDLQETRPNFWKAQYRGNYGVYTIKIETVGKDIKIDDKPATFRNLK